MGDCGTDELGIGLQAVTNNEPDIRINHEPSRIIDSITAGEAWGWHSRGIKLS